jgi:exodeoxyribonuclease VII small subunit
MTRKSTTTDAPLSFEASLTELNRLVEALESGQLSLEASLQAFEQGVKLTRECQLALTQAEQRVKTLLQVDGESVLVDAPSDLA